MYYSKRSFANALHGFQGYDVSGDTKYYELLEVPQTASTEEIKQSFRNLVIKNHPDKGGDAEKFKEITHAYEILVNTEKRAIYDRYGEEGLENDFVTSDDFVDPFDEFSNSANKAKETKKVIKTEDIHHDLPITLEELYKGVEKSFTINRTKICSSCKGYGAKNPGNVHKCKKCNGIGKILKGKFIDTETLTGVEEICPDCKGEGTIIKKQDKCKVCNGKKTVRIKEVMKVIIKPGSEDGDTVKIVGCADELPHSLPGDIIFHIKEKDHQIYQRQGSDLLCVKTISLVDALTGVDFTIPHLNGENITIQSKPNDIYSFGAIRAVDSLGMPNIEGNGYGRLFIKYKIEMPKSLTEEQKKELIKIFKKPNITHNNKENIHICDKVVISSFGKGK